MGILGLSKLIADVAPGAIKENEMKNYFGRKVAIDASMSLYQVYYFSKFLSQRFCTRSPRYSSSFILRYVSQIDDLQYIKDVAHRGVTDWYRYIDSYINSNSKLNDSFHFGNWNIFFFDLIFSSWSQSEQRALSWQVPTARRPLTSWERSIGQSGWSTTESNPSMSSTARYIHQHLILPEQ